MQHWEYVTNGWLDAAAHITAIYGGLIGRNSCLFNSMRAWNKLYRKSSRQLELKDLQVVLVFDYRCRLSHPSLKIKMLMLTIDSNVGINTLTQVYKFSLFLYSVGTL